MHVSRVRTRTGSQLCPHNHVFGNFNGISLHYNKIYFISFQIIIIDVIQPHHLPPPVLL